MREKKNILFTFDYELFLGERSGSVQECLIEPTEEILKILNPYKIKGIFFVDTTYLIFLKKVSLQDSLAERDLNLIFLQLRRLIEQGYYIFPHLHPHWLDAVYLPKVREWQLTDLSRYRFHNLDDNQKCYLFEESIKILQEIVFPINSDYKIDAYRAGGWSIEPFPDFKPFFEKFKIKYDFSVLGGIDSGVFEKRGIYSFQDDVRQEDINGSFVEFPISLLLVSKPASFFNRLWLKIIYRNRNYKKGIGVPSCAKNSSYEMASIELMTIVKLKLYLNFLKKNDYMHFISHPKMISRHNLSTFRKFLENIYDRYQIETDFYKMI